MTDTPDTLDLDELATWCRGVVAARAYWDRVASSVWRGEEIPCAIWTAHLDVDGYGRLTIRVAGKWRWELAHRVAFVVAGGLLTPEKPCVLHRCDRRACVEPSCLFAGSRAENNLDMALKDRGCKSKKGLPYGVKPSRNGRYEASYCQDDKRRHLGTFDTIEEAAAVASAARAVRP